MCQAVWKILVSQEFQFKLALICITAVKVTNAWGIILLGHSVLGCLLFKKLVLEHTAGVTVDLFSNLYLVLCIDIYYIYIYSTTSQRPWPLRLPNY